MQNSTYPHLPSYLALKPSSVKGTSILKLVNDTNGKQGTKSVSTPPAHSSDLCCLGISDSAAQFDYYVKVYSLSSCSQIDKLLIEIMWSSGCRVSEALRLKYTDFSRSGLFKITASKKSNATFARITYNLPYLLAHISTSGYIFHGISRFYVYRLFKKMNLILCTSRIGNNSVTHYFRKQLAADAYHLGNSLENITTVLGHKSANSAIYYKPKS